jgi:hypothetical protein
MVTDVRTERTTEDTMTTYTVTLTAAQGGRNPHAFRGIEADSAADAVVLAYRERHPHATVTSRDVHARGNDISDTRFSIFGTAGAVTFADVEAVEPAAPVEAAPVEVAPVEDTVSARKVWRCAGRSGSMYAKRDAFGYVEVFQSNLNSEREAGTHLFRITA